MNLTMLHGLIQKKIKLKAMIMAIDHRNRRTVKTMDHDL